MKRYNIFELIELIDDLDKLALISALSDAEKKIVNALGDAEYNTLTQPELEYITKIPPRTIKRLVPKLQALGILSSFRDAVKVVILNPSLMAKKDIYRAVRLNLLRINKLEIGHGDLQKRVEDLEKTVAKYGFLEKPQTPFISR